MRPVRRCAALALTGLLAAACASDPAPAASEPTGETAATTTTTAATSDEAVDEAGESTTTSAAAAGSTTTESPASTAPPRVPSAVDLARTPVDVELIASVDNPVAVIVGPNGRDLWVAEQTGRIVRLPDGAGPPVADVGVDLRGEVSSASEQGLLGLALAPDGAHLFTNHTDPGGTTVVTAWTVDGNAVDPGSAVEVLQVEQPARNHNGGHVLFDPDGHLWVGLGDGGGGGDPWEHGQNPDTLLGSMLRFAVDGASLSVPADNPFVDGGGAAEVAVWGVRNPWRFSFDPATGDLWIADVGQDLFEEITVLRRDGEVLGANLGWNLREGDDAFLGGAEPPGHVAPFVDYPQTGGRCSITGGEVYRGDGIPSLDGAYIFSDFCTGELLGVAAEGSPELTVLDGPIVSQPTSFGVDADGELLVLGKPGGVFRLVPG